jgi:nucleotide-binding universal stress UspA family protein
MGGFVVPIKEFSPLALASVRFAIQFGKRSNSRVFFLFVDDPFEIYRFADEAHNALDENNHKIKDEIEALISNGKADEELSMEIHCRRGDLIQEVRQFVNDHHIDGIVLSLPEREDNRYEQVNRDVMTLLQLTHCRILTVRLKK